MTTTITIDLPRARDLLKQAMETKGRDFVYNPSKVSNCMYLPQRPGTQVYTTEGVRPIDVPDSMCQTGCLIGTALKLAGVSDDVLIRIEGSNIRGAAATLSVSGVKVTPEALDYFGKAQWAQDKGSSWGEAYDAAEAAL